MRKLAFVAMALAVVLAVPARAADNLIPVRVALVKTGIVYKFVSRAGTTPFPLPPPSDVAAGAVLGVFDTDNLSNLDTYGLPAGAWTALGSGQGFKYTGTGSAGDPCRIVLVKVNVIKAVCRGSDIKFTTPVSQTGSLGGTLSFNGGFTRYCTDCEGEVIKNVPGIFKSRNCPPPLACQG